MNKLIRVLVVTSSISILASPTLAKDWKKVVIGMDLSYAPWSYTDANGKFMGFEVDLTNDLCARMKVECELTSQSWDTIIPSLEAGKFDAIIAGMSITEERKKKIDFSVPYAEDACVFLTTKSSSYADMPEGDKVIDLEKDATAAKAEVQKLRTRLKGATIGVLTGTAFLKFLEPALQGVSEIRQYKTAEQYVLDLEAGRIDIAFDTTSYLTGVLKGPSGADMKLVGPKLAGGALGYGRGVGLRKSDPELKALFDKAIGEAKNDGKIAALSKKWFGVDISPK